MSSLNLERLGETVGSSAGIKLIIGLTGVFKCGPLTGPEEPPIILFTPSSESPTEVADEQFDKGFSAILDNKISIKLKLVPFLMTRPQNGTNQKNSLF